MLPKKLAARRRRITGVIVLKSRRRQYTVVLSKQERQALYCNTKRVEEPTTTPATLAEAVLWRGFQHLPYITDMFFIMRRNE